MTQITSVTKNKVTILFTNSQRVMLQVNVLEHADKSTEILSASLGMPATWQDPVYARSTP